MKSTFYFLFPGLGLSHPLFAANIVWIAAANTDWNTVRNEYRSGIPNGADTMYIQGSGRGKPVVGSGTTATRSRINSVGKMIPINSAGRRNPRNDERSFRCIELIADTLLLNF